MRTFFLLLILFLLKNFSLRAQVAGCTDPQALNFNNGAGRNDGSCLYAPKSFVPTNTVIVPDNLDELSGMVYWNGLFWGHNDSGNGPWLYAIDTATGLVKKTIGFTGTTNVDWEDIAQDSLHFYIGDFGNNANGNRTNLRILVVSKERMDFNADTLMLNPDQYGVINYTYPDQIDFSASGGNKTKFDCEAMFFHRGKLHLITKNWIGNYSVHYSLPPVPGSYIAVRHDSLRTDGFLITGADIGAEDQMILTAYNASGLCAFYLIYGFDSSIYYFNTGNKRRIKLPPATTTGQLEAVCYINGIRGAIGSERFKVSIFDVTQRISRFSSLEYVMDHYKRNATEFAISGMLRYNHELDLFEYFDGSEWLSLQKDD